MNENLRKICSFSFPDHVCYSEYSVMMMFVNKSYKHEKSKIIRTYFPLKFSKEYFSKT